MPEILPGPSVHGNARLSSVLIHAVTMSLLPVSRFFYLSLSVLHFPAGLESENRLLCSDDAFSVKLTGSLNEFFVAISLK